MEKVDYKVEWRAVFTCPSCGGRNDFVFYNVFEPEGSRQRCDFCGYEVEIGNEVK